MSDSPTDQTTTDYITIHTAKTTAIAAAERQFNEQLDALQSVCPHAELSGWLAGSSYYCKICKRCYKTIESRDYPVREGN